MLISHRGNINGKNRNLENTIDYILNAINLGYNVEVDVWNIKGKWYLGHDNPDNEIDISFLRNNSLWCHAKNLDALANMVSDKNIHCFWHEDDKVTLTTRNFLWTFPGEMLYDNSISVLPETCGQTKEMLYKKQISGICSDYIGDYK